MSELPTARILVVDDESNIAYAIKLALERVGYAVGVAMNGEAALVRLERDPAELVLCDIKLPGMDGMELLQRIKESHPFSRVVMITGYASIESAVSSMKRGATDYLPKPFNPEQLRRVVSNALGCGRLIDENTHLNGGVRHLSGGGAVVGQSGAMRRLYAIAETVAAADSSVLIVGESGTGKEVLARFIHDQSPRKERSFVTVNCAAIPPNLLESELFGHRRGAFTGAVYGRRGSFELADGGTLFLDEIGEMLLEMQAKILRALEEPQIKRVGSENPTPVNVRIIAATNKELEQEIRSGRFREDLYWRLNVVQLHVPALRERREDIIPLVRHFLAFYSRELKKPAPELSTEALGALTRHDWPGNVRELRNAIERAVIFGDLHQAARSANMPQSEAQVPPAPDARAFQSLHELELEHIRRVLESCGGNRARAAEILGVSAVTLWRKLKEWGNEAD